MNQIEQEGSMLMHCDKPAQLGGSGSNWKKNLES